jgi:hypothetical protein
VEGGSAMPLVLEVYLWDYTASLDDPKMDYQF